MTLEDKVIGTIEKQEWIDRAAIPAQRAVRAVLDRVPAVERVLHGEILGHPLHAALVSLPIGAWMVGTALDALELTTGTHRFRRSADLATTVGVGGAVIASPAGLVDWSLTTGVTRRVGFVHGVLNQLVLGTYGLSLYARVRGARRSAIALSLTAFTGLIASAWLGGELAYRLGVGVRLRPEASPPPERIGVARSPSR